MTAHLKLAAIVAAAAATIAGCSEHLNGSPATPQPSAASVSPPSVRAAGPCSLPHFGDLIEWRHEPGKTDHAFLVSDIDVKRCQPTLNNWTEGLPEGPGVCYMIGWAADNVGYNPSALPARPLPKAMDKVGDGC